MPTGVSIHLATPGFVDTPMLRASQAAAVRSVLLGWHFIFSPS